jgi:adenosylhomocysteine nucleosidase
MKKIGMIVAVEDEALRQKYGEGYDLQDGHGTLLYQTKQSQVYALHSGAGEILAAAATQYLIDRYEVAAVLNYGVVGACTAGIKAGETCIVGGVVHHQYDISEVDGVETCRYLEYPDRVIQADQELVGKAMFVRPDLRVVTCASGDKFMGDPAEKTRLHEELGADICDMESAAILLTCDRNRVPCLIVKTVSDGVRGGAEEYWRMKNQTALACLDVVDGIIDEL